MAPFDDIVARAAQGSLVDVPLAQADAPRTERAPLDLDQRADDAPAYFTILLVGHIVVPGILIAEQWYKPDTMIQLAIWLPVTLIATLALLPIIKGATIAAIWATKRS